MRLLKAEMQVRGPIALRYGTSPSRFGTGLRSKVEKGYCFRSLARPTWESEPAASDCTHSSSATWAQRVLV